MPSYSPICIGWPQRGQAIAGMTIDFFHLRFALDASPRPSFGLQKTRTPAECGRSGEHAISKSGKLELRWHVAIGWHVAVDFETDADFNQNRCRPSHAVSSFGSREIVEPKEHRTASGGR